MYSVLLSVMDCHIYSNNEPYNYMKILKNNLHPLSPAQVWVCWYHRGGNLLLNQGTDCDYKTTVNFYDKPISFERNLPSKLCVPFSMRFYLYFIDI